MCPTLCNPMNYSLPGLCPWDFPGKNTGVGCHFLLQGIFLTLGWNLHLLPWQMDYLPVSHLGSPPHKHSIPNNQHLPPGWNIVTNDEPTLTNCGQTNHSLPDNSHLVLYFSLVLDKFIMTCTNHIFLQSIFTVLKVLSAPIHPSIPNPWKPLIISLPLQNLPLDLPLQNVIWLESYKM